MNPWEELARDLDLTEEEVQRGLALMEEIFKRIGRRGVMPSESDTPAPSLPGPLPEGSGEQWGFLLTASPLSR